MSLLNNRVLMKLSSIGLVPQIVVGIIAGCLLAVLAPDFAQSLSILGTFFVSALKAVAPILVFVLVASAIANQKVSSDVSLKPIVGLYFFGTLMAAFVAVVLSFLFPSTLTLDLAGATANPPQGLMEVLNTLLFKIVVNPIDAIAQGNFIGILAWGIGLGFAMKKSSESSKLFLFDISQAISTIVKLVIRLAPIGILGLVANTVATTGFTTMGEYGHLVAVLLSAMLVIALVINPIIVFALTRKNP